MTSASRPIDSPPRSATGRLSSRDRRTVIPLSAVVMESLFRFGQVGYLVVVTSGEVPFDGVALPTSATMTPAPRRAVAGYVHPGRGGMKSLAPKRDLD